MGREGVARRRRGVGGVGEQWAWGLSLTNISCIHGNLLCEKIHREFQVHSEKVVLCFGKIVSENGLGKVFSGRCIVLGYYNTT